MKYITKIAFLLFLACQAGYSPASGAPDRSRAQTAVIIVRHAERADDSSDSELSPAGRDRAEQLARMLRDIHPSALYATEYKRTQQTLRPLADEVRLPIEIILTPSK